MRGVPVGIVNHRLPAATMDVELHATTVSPLAKARVLVAFRTVLCRIANPHTGSNQLLYFIQPEAEKSRATPRKHAS
eukprot:1989904-Amphidinium_carterae.3